MTSSKKIILISAGDPSSVSSEITIKAIKSSKIDENLFLNIGTGVETSVNELVSTLKNTIGYEGKVLYYPKRDGELLRSVLDNSKAKKVLGWDPKFSLNDGIIELIQWLKA